MHACIQQPIFTTIGCLVEILNLNFNQLCLNKTSKKEFSAVERHALAWHFNQ